MSDPALEERRAAVTAAGSALRAATVALAATEVSVDDLVRAAELADELAQILEKRTRPLNRQASVDDLSHGIRYFSPVTGLGNPMAPPLAFERTADGVATRVTLDRRFEGPPGFVHGGITGLLLDEVLGQANTHAGRWGMTAFLNITYRRALPIDVELVMSSGVTRIDDRKTFVSGRIALASDPDRSCVDAEALFVAPRDTTYDSYFSGYSDIDGNVISAAHGSPEMS